jgi:hypothetical protein
MQLSNRHWLGAAKFAAVMKNISTNTESRLLDAEKSVVKLVTRVKPDLKHFGRLQFGQLVVVSTSQYETGHPSYLTCKNQLAAHLSPKLDGSGASYVILEGGLNPSIRKQLTIIRTRENIVTTELAQTLFPTIDADGTTKFQSTVPVDFNLSNQIRQESAANFTISEKVIAIEDSDRTTVPEIGWGGQKLQLGVIIARSTVQNGDGHNIINNEHNTDTAVRNDNTLITIDIPVPNETYTGVKSDSEMTNWNDDINHYSEEENTTEKLDLAQSEQRNNFRVIVLKMLK